MRKTTEHGFKPGGYLFFDVIEFDVGQWCPDAEAKVPPTQVHLTLVVREFQFPFVVRFKSPATLGLLIEQLARHGNGVWPGSFVVGKKGEGHDSP
jgi:hypothetical protein